MIGLELLARVTPTILIIFLLENFLKMDKYEKVYIFSSFLLLSNVITYFVLDFLEYNIYFSPLFSVKFALVLLVINAIVLYIFLVFRDKYLNRKLFKNPFTKKKVKKKKK